MKAKTFLEYCENIHEQHSKNKIDEKDALFKIYTALRFYSQIFDVPMLFSDNKIFKNTEIVDRGYLGKVCNIGGIAYSYEFLHQFVGLPLDKFISAVPTLEFTEAVIKDYNL